MTTISGRIGAAAFAVGLSLAGPHGIAVADDAESTSSASAGESGPSPHQQAGHPRRGARAAAVGVARSPRSAPSSAASEVVAPTPVGPLAGARHASDTGLESDPDLTPVADQSARDRRAPGITAEAANRGPTADPEAPAVDVGVDTAVPNPAPLSAGKADPVLTVVGPAAARSLISVPPRPAASLSQPCSGCGVFAALAVAPAPVPAQAVTVMVAAARVLDEIGSRLHRLPAGPINEFLSGALLLLRRNLFPMVPTIPAVSVGDVLVDENSPQALFTVTLDRAYDSTVTVGYTTTSALTEPAAEPGDKAARATAGVDYEPESGILVFAPGQTTQQVGIALRNDGAAEVTETFSLEIVATWAPAASAAASPSALATSANQPTSVVLATATASIVDDDRVKIDVNPNFAYGDALWAGIFSDLAYNHRNDEDFSGRVEATGWQGIGVSGPALGADGYSPTAGGYGVRDGLSMQSFAFAGKRTAADGTEQFVVAFEGSNVPPEEWLPADWVLNAGKYGWSRYYASLEPLMSEVVVQMLQAQQDQRKTQLIITGHSLGGAGAMMAFADLLAPQGNLWPGTTDVLSAGTRVLDTVGGWSPEVRTALLAATSVYTFGAPSILIDPVKLGAVEAGAFGALATGGGLFGAVALLQRALGVLTVDDKKLPDFTGIAGINFGTRVFQFEHANTSWLPPYPGDIVAQIGSRDPGRVLQINLDNSVHEAYTGWLMRYVPGSTHFMGLYQESLTRLVTNSRLLKVPNKLAGDSPQLARTSPGTGSDTRNDFFVDVSDDGKGGNDLFVFSSPGTYSASGGAGTDAYSITGYNVALTIDGATQSGRDTVVFDLAGTPGARYFSSGSGPANDTAVFSVTGADGKSSSVTITHWDRWQISDIFQVIKPANGRWTLDAWNDIERGVVVSTPANEIPLSVL